MFAPSSVYMSAPCPFGGGIITEKTAPDPVTTESKSSVAKVYPEPPFVT